MAVPRCYTRRSTAASGSSRQPATDSERRGRREADHRVVYLAVWFLTDREQTVWPHPKMTTRNRRILDLRPVAAIKPPQTPK
eukprot:2196788-Amphidinium_carterae.1